MKTKWIGLIVVIIVAVCAVAFSNLSGSEEPGQPAEQAAPTELSGYVGGEKIGFLEDEEVQKVLEEEYHLELDYAKAGSMDMVTADKEGKNFLWPSSQTALELYKAKVGKPLRSETIFNTPIVIYTRKPVAKALMKKGVVTEKDGVYRADLAKLIRLIRKNTKWSDIGLDQLYGNITISSTDPVKSNSGNMYAGLLANTLVDGVATRANVAPRLEAIKSVFEKSGYMESSSADIFSEFLKLGMGAKPLCVGYENQLLEFSKEEPETWKKLKDDVVMLYPTPTVWSSHVWIAMDQESADAIDALTDKKIQKLAWERHGFRTDVSSSQSAASVFPGTGVAEDVTQVAPMPDYKTMEMIIDYISK